MQTKEYKPARRKTWAYFITLFTICITAAMGAKFDWALVVLIISLFLIYVGGISTEKIFLELFRRKFGTKISAETEV